MSDALAHDSVAARIVVVATVALLAVTGVMGGIVFAIVGPRRAAPGAVAVFAFAGVSGSVAFGMHVPGGALAPGALAVVTAVALVVHLVAAPELAGDGERRAQDALHRRPRERR